MSMGGCLAATGVLSLCNDELSEVSRRQTASIERLEVPRILHTPPYRLPRLREVADRDPDRRQKTVSSPVLLFVRDDIYLWMIANLRRCCKGLLGFLRRCKWTENSVVEIF